MACGVALWLCTFSIYYATEAKFDSLGVFQQHNVLFDADPMFRIRSFASGTGWGDHSLIHPNLGTYFSLPNRVVARVATGTGLYDGPEEDLRRAIALLVGPAFAASTMTLVFALFLATGFSLPEAGLVSMLGAFSFSHLIFGSMPDHFVIGGFCVAASFCLASDLIRRGGNIRWVFWTGLGMLTLGITVSNIAWVGVVLLLALLASGRPATNVFRQMGIWLLVVLTLTGVTADIGRRVYQADTDQTSLEWNAEFIEEYWTGDALGRLRKAPAAVANAFAPAGISTRDNRLARQYGYGRTYMFTLEQPRSALVSLVVLVLLTVGTVGCLGAGTTLRVLALGSWLILAGNLTLHAFFGSEYFLYSQHLLVPALILLAGNLRVLGQHRKVAIGALAAVTALILLNNVTVLRELLTILATGPSAVSAGM